MSESVAKALPKWEELGGAPIDTSRLKILAVDDNEALRYSLVRSLRDAGYQVIEAKNGAEALLLAKGLPDLITLDVNLPDMLGFDVCRKIKSDPATSHIPVLHLSSTFIDPDARVKGLASGADAYLAEPIDRAELVATVAALLRLKTAETIARQQAEAAEQARRELTQLNETLEQRVQERTIELKKANQNLRELSIRLLEAQDDERRHIARNLHDSVGQLLAAIKMNNAVIAADHASLSSLGAKALNDNDLLTDEILKSIRTTSHLLHPPLLDEVGLPSALRWYVEEFSERSGIHVELECSSSFERLPRELETSIFRIVQESLGNVHRHSGSSTAVIRLSARQDKVYLEIRDEGRGITPDRQRELKQGTRGGVGIRGMLERIARFGGELNIESPGRGTVITAILPNSISASSDGFSKDGFSKDGLGNHVLGSAS
jgi:signal transduction histidine kinase